jgi:hypothetical protein
MNVEEKKFGGRECRTRYEKRRNSDTHEDCERIFIREFSTDNDRTVILVSYGGEQIHQTRFLVKIFPLTMFNIDLS